MSLETTAISLLSVSDFAGMLFCIFVGSLIRIIKGADYGTGKRGSKLSQFLCAVRDDRISDETNPK